MCQAKFFEDIRCRDNARIEYKNLLHGVRSYESKDGPFLGSIHYLAFYAFRYQALR